jgi:DICT domain-containing protein
MNQGDKMAGVFIARETYEQAKEKKMVAGDLELRFVGLKGIFPDVGEGSAKAALQSLAEIASRNGISHIFDTNHAKIETKTYGPNGYYIVTGNAYAPRAGQMQESR